MPGFLTPTTFRHDPIAFACRNCEQNAYSDPLRGSCLDSENRQWNLDWLPLLAAITAADALSPILRDA